MFKLYSPRDDGELALLRSLLDAAAIPYFVSNDQFGSLTVGPRVGGLNVKTLMVPEEFREQAEDLVADFLGATAKAPERHSTIDRIRMVFEAVLFGWFVPGGRRRRGKGPVAARPDDTKRDPT